MKGKVQFFCQDEVGKINVGTFNVIAWGWAAYTYAKNYLAEVVEEIIKDLDGLLAYANPTLGIPGNRRNDSTVPNGESNIEGTKSIRSGIFYNCSYTMYGSLSLFNSSKHSLMD